MNFFLLKQIYSTHQNTIDRMSAAQTVTSSISRLEFKNLIKFHSHIKMESVILASPILEEIHLNPILPIALFTIVLSCTNRYDNMEIGEVEKKTANLQDNWLYPVLRGFPPSYNLADRIETIVSAIYLCAGLILN